MTLKSHQTGPEGKLVRKVYVEAGSDIAHEYYLGVVLDRESEEKLAIIASTEGGVEIEEVAAEKTPEKIITVNVDAGATSSRASRRGAWASASGFDAEQVKKLEVFLSTGSSGSSSRRTASLAEINPLVLTAGRRPASPSTAKLNFDDNALYRHPDAGASCATPTRRTPASARPTRSTSPTWASTATSAAW